MRACAQRTEHLRTSSRREPDLIDDLRQALDPVDARSRPAPLPAEGSQPPARLHYFQYGRTSRGSPPRVSSRTCAYVVRLAAAQADTSLIPDAATADYGWLYAVTLQPDGMLSFGGYAAAVVVEVATPLEGTVIGAKEATY